MINPTKLFSKIQRQFNNSTSIQINGNYERNLKIFNFLLIISNAFKLFKSFEIGHFITNTLIIVQICMVIFKLSKDIEKISAEAGKRKMNNNCSNISSAIKSIIAINILSQFFSFYQNQILISSILALSFSSYLLQSYLSQLRVPKVVADTEYASKFLKGFIVFGIVYSVFSSNFSANQFVFDSFSIGISSFLMFKAPKVGEGVWKLFVERSNVPRS